MDQRRVTLFYSYSHRDEELRDKLDEHLASLKRRGAIAAWHDRKITAGAEWKTSIDHHVDAADIILLLVSSSFIASDYCWEQEMTRALQRHDRKEARVIPVILRPCVWRDAPFARLQVVPTGAVPVTQWPSPDEAFVDVALAIQRAVDELHHHRAGPDEPPASQSCSAPAAVPTPPGVVAPTLPPIAHGALDGRAVADLAVFKDVEASWCPEMVALPSGQFLMGCTDEEFRIYSSDSNRWRRHRVDITRRFAIGRYEVTFDEFDAFCAASGRWKPADQGWGRGRRPVINVTWADATAYCEWLTSQTGKPYRLPGEAEWEYACRAGTTTSFAFGDSISTAQARYGLMAWSTRDVGSYRPNLWGLFDMHGNVEEWVLDVWHDDYEGAPTDGSPWLDGSAVDRRVARGGSYFALESGLVRSNWRCSRGHMESSSSLGFRVARTL